MAAKESAMHLLHEMLAQTFLDDMVACKEAGIPMSSADKSAIAKFLKDSNVTMTIDLEACAAINTEFKDDLAARREANAAAMLLAVVNDDPMRTFL